MHKALEHDPLLFGAYLQSMLLQRNDFAISICSPLGRCLDEVAELLAPFFSRIPGHRPKDAWELTVGPGSGEIIGDLDVAQPVGEPQRVYEVRQDVRVIVVREPDDPVWQVQHLLRLVRFLYRASLASKVSLFPHGAMVSREGRGIALIGEKRAGKTTSVLSLLAKSCDFVANDDLSFVEEHGVWFGVGSSRAIAVRRDVSQLSHLRDHLGEHRSLRHPANRRAGLLMEYTHFYPQELVGRFKCGIAERAVLAGIALISFGAEEATLAPVDRDKARGAIMEQIGDYADRYSAGLVALAGLGALGNDALRVDERIRCILRQVPAYRIELAWHDMEASADTLLTLFDLTARKLNEDTERGAHSGSQ